MICRVCGQNDSSPLWADLDGYQWRRCLYCGSDSSTSVYADIAHLYDEAYLWHTLHTARDDWPRLVEEMNGNCAWFARFTSPERTFLDIGCCEGAGMAAMQARGWAVHGFDVIAGAKTGTHVTIASEFRANLFDRQYGAVMTREVIEHVPDWAGFLRECFSALLPGGFFQVQTPRPVREFHGQVYYWGHLQVFAPLALRLELERAGFTIVGHESWERGQLWMCRKSGGTL